MSNNPGSTSRTTTLIIVLTWANLAILIANFLYSTTAVDSVYDAHDRAARRGEIRTEWRTVPVDSMAVPAPPPQESLDGDAPIEPMRRSYVELSDADRKALLDHLYVETRVQTRAFAVMNGIDHLQESGKLRVLDPATRKRIAEIGVAASRSRAALERSLICDRDTGLDEFTRVLREHDERTADRVSTELSQFLNKQESKHLLRYLVSSRYSIGSVR